MDTIVKVDSILANVATLKDEDLANIIEAKNRIKQIGHGRTGGLDQTDKDALNRLDAILNLHRLLPR